MFDFSSYSVESKYYHDSDALVVAKIKDQMVDVAIKEFVGLNSKILLDSLEQL